MSHTSMKSSSPDRITLKGNVVSAQVSLPLLVLIDSGSDDNFIDIELVAQSNIPSELLSEPKDVFALNGRLLTLLMHCTAPVSLLLSGNHHETISLFIIPAPTSPLVLGLPWLKLHDPHIDLQLEPVLPFPPLPLVHQLHLNRSTSPLFPLTIMTSRRFLVKIALCHYHLTDLTTVALIYSQALHYPPVNCIISPCLKGRPWKPILRILSLLD